jgi:hypothetical protein
MLSWCPRYFVFWWLRCSIVIRAQVLLTWDEASTPSWPGCVLPTLVTTFDAPPLLPVSVDGSIAFGDVVVATGTGRVTPDPSAGPGATAVLNCRVKVQLRRVDLGDAGAESSREGGWLTVWEKEILFSDDASHLTKVAVMSQAQQKYAVQAKVRPCRCAMRQAH